MGYFSKNIKVNNMKFQKSAYLHSFVFFLVFYMIYIIINIYNRLLRIDRHRAGLASIL